MERTFYRNESWSADMWAKDMLSRMTLVEKLAQVGSVWSYELLQEGKFSQRKAQQFMKHGIGQITRPGGATGFDPERVAEFVNSVQRFLVEETRLGIPAIMHDECLAGLLTKGATQFPQPIALASTWTPDLVREMAVFIRDQMYNLGIRQGLAPVLDVAYDPRWGRTEESFGEDPYLVASMGVAYVRGLQGENLSQGVIATLKHFVGYSASEGGLNCAPAHIGERELREVFLLPFESAVREAGALSVMNAYHEIDGIPCAVSRRLLTEVLREKWGFPGFVVSDYSAIPMLVFYHQIAKDGVEAAELSLKAGIDIELPQTDCYGVFLQECIKRGLISEELLDAAVFRVLRAKFLLGLIEHPFVEIERVKHFFSPPKLSEGQKLAREIARRSIVLLKNGGILPLSKSLKTIAVIGPNADTKRNLLGDYAFPTHLEHFVERTTAKGIDVPLTSKELNCSLESLEIPTVLEAIQKRVDPKTQVLFAKGCEVTGTSREGFAQAVQIAKKAQVAVVVIGDRSGLTQDCTSGETRDLATLKLPGVQEELILALSQTGTPIVLVLICGRPYSLVSIIDKVNAVMLAWFPGEAGGEPVAEALFGDLNPGGKLPISFPRSPGQLPIYYYRKPSGGKSYWWGTYVDEDTKPLFAFGHGLSYTSFEYSGLEVRPREVHLNEKVEVKVRVKNIGPVEGDEVVQLFISRKHASVTRPVRELKGFKRVSLKPSEEKTVVFVIPLDTLAYYDTDMNLVIEPGEIVVMVGASSDDIRCVDKFTIVGEKRVLAEISIRKYFSEAIITNEKRSCKDRVI